MKKLIENLVNNKKAFTGIQLATLIVALLSVIVSFNYFLQNQLDYPGSNQNLVEYFIKYGGAIFTIFVLPGLVTVLSLNLKDFIPTKLQIFTIPIISLTYWIVVSLITYTISGTFAVHTLFFGVLVLAIIFLITLLRNKSQLNASFKNLLFTLPRLLVVLIPCFIIFSVYSKVFYTHNHLPNFDSQTHSQIVSNMIDWHTLQITRIYGNSTATYNNQSFYPLGYHIISALTALSTGDFVPAVARNIVILTASLTPVFVFTLFYYLTKKPIFSTIAAFISILFFWFPYKPLTWGGSSLMFGALLMLPYTGFIYYSLKKYGLKNLAANLLVILLSLIGFSLHPSSMIVMLILLALLLVPHLPKLYKSLDIRIVVATIVLGILIAVAIYYRDLLNLGTLYSQQITDKVAKAASEDSSIHLSSIFRGFLTAVSYWFSYSSPVLLILTGVGIGLSIVKRNKQAIAISIFAVFIVMMGAIVAGTENIPVLEQIGNIWFNNIQRVLYALYVPIIFFITLAVSTVWNEIEQRTAKLKLSPLTFFVLLLLIVGPLYFQNISLLQTKFGVDIDSHSPKREEMDAYKFFNTLESGTVIGLPSRYFIHEKNLNWLNSISPKTPTLIDRATPTVSYDELIKRRAVIFQIEGNGLSVCSLNTSNETADYNIKYIYLTRYPYYEGDVRNDQAQIDTEFKANSTLVQNSGCTTQIYKTEWVEIYKID